MSRTISNSDDVLDSRDVIARIEELRGEREALAEAQAELKAWDESEGASELKALESLAAECEGYASDWRHGEALIRDTHFEDYARELAEDCGMVKGTDTWPGRCIDWDQAAEELQQDYTSADWDGVTYWVRCS